MALAVLISPILNAIMETLTPILTEEFRLLWGVDDELENLKSTLSDIQDVLADAEERQITEKSVQHWLIRLKDVAYEADDLVDEFAYEALRLKSEDGTETSDRKQQVCKFFPSCIGLKQVSFRRDIAHKIKDITEKLDTISKDRERFHLRVGDGGRRNQNIERPLTTSLMKVPESGVLGRKKDREEIIKLLMSDEAPSGKDVSVVSIVGMGGIGKTTLAQLIYNDEKIANHFQIRAWVCVSENFDVKRLTQEIIESATRNKSHEFSNNDPMQKDLQEILRCKRFLIVLDDVWNEKRDDWESLQAPFIGGKKGSQILVTTRSVPVSNTMDTNHLYHLGILNDDDALSLFRQHAFVDGNSDGYPTLMEIGEKLIRQCKGLPLAVKALGGLLSTKRDESSWRRVLESKIWSSREDIDILPALKVSYHHLPARLKQCFAYCSIFPKDYEFKKDTLVQMWMGQGFIFQKGGGDKSLEDTGSEYFDYLLMRSFFQQDQDQDHSKYKMHDLMHDLAQSVSSDDCLRVEHGNKPIHVAKKDHRHLSFFVRDNTEVDHLEASYEFKGLRTLILRFHGWPFLDPLDVDSDVFVKLRYLRVLDFSRALCITLPKSVNILKHLRYLDLSNGWFEQLPESVNSFYNLQTLKLYGCINLHQLPRETRKLLNLRHLNLVGCEDLESMPVEIGRLTCLQTLSKFVVGSERGCGIGELKNLTKLKGAIEISNLQNVANANEAEEANLKNKRHIDELDLQWGRRRLRRRHILEHDIQSNSERAEMNQQDEASFEEFDKVFEALQPHTNIKILSIWGYKGRNFPSWMQPTMLPNLVRVTLDHCTNNVELLPPLGQLHKLEKLEIFTMNGVKRIGHEFCGDGEIRAFPSLKYLGIHSMDNLEEWCGVVEGELPCLEELVFAFCPKLVKLPILSALKDLHLMNCNALTSLPKFPSLVNLRLFECKALTSLPKLPLLVNLTLTVCNALTSLPKLPSLLYLHWWECNEMLFRSELHLTSLSTLEIYCLPELTSIPQGLLQTLTQLKILTIGACERLLSLVEEDGLQDRGLPVSLTILKIVNCQKLKSLPKGMPNLTSLKRLEIQLCPQLEERCRKEEGEDWFKISHIPHININGEKISSQCA